MFNISIKKQENFNSTKKIIQDYISQFELRFTVKNKKTKNQIRKIKKFLTSKFLRLNEFSREMNNTKFFKIENYMIVFH